MARALPHRNVIAVLIALAFSTAFLLAAFSAQYAVADQAANPDSTLAAGEASIQNPREEIEPSLVYSAHMQGGSWGARTEAPTPVGSVSRKTAIDAFTITVDPGTSQGGISYRSHMAKAGWGSWKQGPERSGKVSSKTKLDAVAMKLTGDLAKTHIVVYRVYQSPAGWLPWTSGGASAGKANGERIQAIQARIVKRPEPPQAAPTVEDGLYSLSPASASSLRVAVSQGSAQSGANVRLESKASYQLEQTWKVTWKGDGYELMNAYSGRVLDAAKGLSNCLANVRQEKRSTASTQRWAIEPVSNGGYRLLSMECGTRLAAVKSRMKAGCNLALALPDSTLPSTFKLKSATVLPTGCVKLFSGLGRTRLSACIPKASTSNGTQAKLARSGDALEERFVIAAHDGYFTIQAACSGRYLTAHGGAVVQRARNHSQAQRWMATVTSGGGLQLVNAANGDALAVKNASRKSGAKLVLASPSSSEAQRWLPRTTSLVPSGLYEIRARTAPKLRLDVKNASIKRNANAILYKRTNGNNQKFVILPAGNGYYRIKMALGSCVLASAGTHSASNVRMEARRSSATQLWKPIVTDSGIAFANKKSGKRLSCTKAHSGANIRLSSGKTPERLVTWTLSKTKLNRTDEASFRNAIGAAPGGGLKLGNASGYKVEQKLWKRLNDAVSGCRARGADVSFIMVDLSTGMTVSLNPDKVRFGASTIKGLYVTYLFEEYLEKGRLSWEDIGSLAWPTIVHSNNDAYRSLRARFGTESGFARWLGSAGVGPIGTWGDYSARTLAKAWTHMAGYAASNGRYVGRWKSLFNHSDHSFIHEALGGSNATYSKPGWMEVGTWSGPIMNDAALVEKGKNNRYVLAFTSTVNPDAHRYVIGRVASALDAIQKDMTKKRGW